MSISEVDSPPRSIPTPRAPEVHNKESNTAAHFLESSSMATTTESKRNIPTWVWIVLAFAIVGVSSAGTLFQQVSEVPPILRASWRLQSTSVLLIPFAVWEWKTCVQSIRNRCFERDTLAILVASSIAVAAHFGLWVVSLDLVSRFINLIEIDFKVELSNLTFANLFNAINALSKRRPLHMHFCIFLLVPLLQHYA